MRKSILCVCTLYVYINLIFAKNFKIKYERTQRIWKFTPKLKIIEEINISQYKIELESEDMFIFLQIIPSTQDKSIYYWVGNSTEMSDRKEIATVVAKLWHQVKKLSRSNNDNKLPAISREAQGQESAYFQLYFGPLVNTKFKGDEYVTTTELYEIQRKNQEVTIDLVPQNLNNFSTENGYILYDENTIKYYEPCNDGVICEVVDKLILQIWNEKCITTNENKNKKPRTSTEIIFAHTSPNLSKEFKGTRILQKQKSFKESLQSAMKTISCRAEDSVDIEKEPLLRSKSHSNRMSGSGKQLLESTQKGKTIHTVDIIDNEIKLKSRKFETMHAFIDKTCIVHNYTYYYIFVYIGYESSFEKVEFALKKVEKNSNLWKIIIVVNEGNFVPVSFWIHFPDFGGYLISGMSKFPAKPDHPGEQSELSHAYEPPDCKFPLFDVTDYRQN